VKSFRALIPIESSKRQEIIDVTGRVEELVAASGIGEGLALVHPMHTSCACYLSDSDASLTDDLTQLLGRIVPPGSEWRHDRGDDKKNAAGHLKGIILGHHCVLAVSGGHLDLGTYQTIWYAELDGRREKSILVKIVGE